MTVPKRSPTEGGEQTGTGSKIQLIHDRRERGLEDTQRDDAGKPQVMENNTSLPFDLCLREREREWCVCGYVMSAFIWDQGQAVFVMQD